MNSENVSAKELCELANQYQPTASELTDRCLRSASQQAKYAGEKTSSSAFNSGVVSEETAASVKKQLEGKGFRVSVRRNDKWINFELDFDVCDVT